MISRLKFKIIRQWIKTHKYKNWKHRTSSSSHNFYNDCSLFWPWCFLSIYRILAKFPGGGADGWQGGKHSQCSGDRRQCVLTLAVLSRPPPVLTPTETYCPPEHCLPRVRDIPSVIGADDLLHKHWHHKEGSTWLRTISDNVTSIFQRSFREIITYRWMRGREEATKGLAQNFTIDIQLVQW